MKLVENQPNLKKGLIETFAHTIFKNNYYNNNIIIYDK